MPVNERNPMKIDFEIADDGAMVLFTPLTERARHWVEANLIGIREWFGAALMVEEAMAPLLVDEMINYGMVFRPTSEAYSH